MKQIILLLTCLFVLTSIQAQISWDKAGIEAATKDFITLLATNQVGEATIKYSHSKLFERARAAYTEDLTIEELKTEIKKQIDQATQDSAIQHVFRDFSIQNISSILEIDDIFYTKVDVNFTSDRIFGQWIKRKGVSFDPFETNQSLLKTMYGEENVTINEATRTISINRKGSYLAIGNQTSDGWKFMSFEAQQLLTYGIVSKELWQKLKELREE